MRITEQELLDALAAASPGAGPEDARTQEEIAIASCLSIKRVRVAMRALQQQGRLIPHRVMRTRMDGVQTPVTAYTIKS